MLGWRSMSSDELDPMLPESWRGVPNVCGSCIAFRSGENTDGDEVAHGRCQLRRELGRIPADLKKCGEYRARGVFTYQPGAAPRSPKRRVAKTVQLLVKSGDGQLVEKTISRARAESVGFVDPPEPRDDADARGAESRPVGWTPPARAAAPKTLDLGELRSAEVARYALVELVRHELGRSRRELHPRFKGGKVFAEHGDARRVVPAERFFAWLDRLRASLDQLEEAVVERAEAIGEPADELRSQVLRMQGSLTTFNLLFADREDYFSGKE
jgi:hypothetical protein